MEMRELLINEKNISLMAKKENTSFNIKKLLGVDIDQSQSIRFGNMFQEFIKNLVISKGGKILPSQFIDVYKTGNTKSNKGLKDMDIWFILDDIMYYFEVKTNLDLDSEKSKATDNKIFDITKYLIIENQNTKVKTGILSCWYKREHGLPIKVKTPVCYIEDMFKILNIQCTSDEYYKLMLDFGKSISL